ncbi:hypothetical protein [Lutibacter citreus]|uniref:hypothetical protein n=1 Tax=Lutibacter citreus TaxID=2138210 RepID=UPI000DBE2B82|nr:hypothetical protein [Lutibacter citreus]
MNEIEFIDRVKAKSIESKKLIEGNGGYKIKRGMAHSISGFVEDLFALYVAEYINRDNLEYFVDKVISIRLNKNEKARSFKPDLMIINSENIMTHYFDLKTNLGWNRYLENYITEKNDFINQLRGRKAWINLGKNEKAKDVVISENLKYHMVVIYGGNINQETMINNLKIASNLENIEIDTLYHKNDDNANFEIDYKAFENIHNSILA